MNYSVVVTASAKSDIRETARWLGEQASPTVAERWLAGLRKSINTLTSHPRRCPLAAESDKFPVEVRELLHGRSKTGKYRILFRVDGDTVSILYVRHAARNELEP
jgi:plasmid stabilization system protein ParE